MNDDVITVGNLVEALSGIDPLLWVCITVEGHAYPMTISNIGMLETNKSLKDIQDPREKGMFFLDITRQSFVKFVEKEIIDPLMQRSAFEKDSPPAVLQ